MNEKQKKEFRKSTESGIALYLMLSADDQNKPKVLNVLTKEVELMKDLKNDEEELKMKKERMQLEKLKIEKQIQHEEAKLRMEDAKIKLEKRKLDLEVKKFKNMIDMDNMKVELEKQKIGIEMCKLDIDSRKLDIDSRKLEAEISKNQQEKKNSFLGIVIQNGVRLLEITSGVWSFARIMYLVYKDDGRAIPELKDVMKLFTRGK